MRQFICNDFVLDLEFLKLQDTEESSWFSDSFFSKYSFPAEIDLTDDRDKAFGFISQYLTEPKTYFEGKYVHNNKIEDAIFEVEQYQQKLSCTLRFGFEELPSFTKKLSELSLYKADAISPDIYTVADYQMRLSYPDVFYNFPMVHTEHYDTSTDTWAFFKGIINHRKSGAFLKNIYNSTEEWSENYNIMQPMPYLLYILERGMIDAGYTLGGEILNDEKLKKALVYFPREYKLDEPFSLAFSYLLADHFEKIDNLEVANSSVKLSRIKYKKFYFNLNSFDYFKLAGSIDLPQYPFCNLIDGTPVFGKVKLFVNGINVLTQNFQGDFSTVIDYSFFGGEINGGTAGSVNTIAFEAEIFIEDSFYQSHITDFILDLNITRLAKSNGVFHTDPNYILYPSIAFNQIDLTKSVPDITFADLVKFVKNYFNYDIIGIENKVVIMDKVESNINVDGAVDLSAYEVRYPLRKFQQGSSYLLKFQDIENTADTTYSFEPVFVNKNGMVTTGYKTDDKTNTIEINGLPLPLLGKNGVNTAHAFENDTNKVYLVFYDGLNDPFINAQGQNDGINTTDSNAPYLLPVVYNEYWKRWFNLRINAQNFTWSFKIWNEKLNFNVKTKVFAYGRFHVLKTINKTEIRPDLFEVELETETI